MVLVGNNCHLIDQRVITTKQGEDLARTFGCPFFEASAETGVNVHPVFKELVTQFHRSSLLKSKHTLNDGDILQMLKDKHPTTRDTSLGIQ